MQEVQEFGALGVDRKFARALSDAEYHRPSKIQALAIPALLKGGDVLGVAQTGTGKTAAFGLPLLQRLDKQNTPAQARHPRALILAPTRELAIQIHKELAFFARATSLTLTAIYGGVGQNPQVNALRKGVDILVATPGRLLDLVTQKHLRLGHVSVLVLDEADRLLDMGFVRDVQRIVKMTPQKRQSLLFSATMPAAVADLAAQILSRPERIDVAPKQVTVEKIDQHVVMVGTADKRRVLEYLLFDAQVTKAIVFARTKHGAEKLARQLRSSGISAEAIHGNKSQNARTRALENFKKGEIWVLVATDIAARGIDIEGVSHVVNFELPHEPESYVHRIGRTGRAGASGRAWSLVDPGEMKRLRAVEKFIRSTVHVMKLDIPLAAVEDIKQDRPREADARGNKPESNRNGSRGRNTGTQKHSQTGEGNGASGQGRRRPRRRKVRANAA